ncbi:MAG: hypothetical protein QXK08_03170 [Candidatus Woesearchaeota archaeon]
MPMRAKDWLVVGVSAAVLAGLSIVGYHGIRDSVSGAWSFAWEGVKSRKPEQPTVRNYDVTIGSGQHYRFSVPVSSEVQMDNFLDAHKNSCSPFQVGLELMMADADDGNVDGVMTDASVTKLVNSDFCRLARLYNGEFPVADVAGKTKQRYELMTPSKRPCVPGH